MTGPFRVELIVGGTNRPSIAGLPSMHTANFPAASSALPNGFFAPSLRVRVWVFQS